MEPSWSQDPYGLIAMDTGTESWLIDLKNPRGRFLNNLPCGLLADEAGLGKSAQVVALLAYLKDRWSLRGPHLVTRARRVSSYVLERFSVRADCFANGCSRMPSETCAIC